MICYTNHALDQFLEYCIRECHINSGVVRVGGRSKSVNLDSFFLPNIKRNMRHERKFDSNIHHAIKLQEEVLRSIEQDLKNLNNLLNFVSKRGLLKFETIKDFMTDSQRDYFVCNNEDSSSDLKLLEWLGIFNIEDFDLNDVASIELQIDRLKLYDQNIEDEEQEEKEENNNDDDSFSDERMLEDDFDTNIIANYIKSRNEILKHKIHSDIFLDEEDIFEMLVTYNTRLGSKKLNQFLYLHHTEKEFQLVENRKQKKKNQESKPFNQFVYHYLNMILNYEDETVDDEDQTENVLDLDELTYQQRFKMYREWLKMFLELKSESGEELSKNYNIKANELKELRLQEDLFVMKNAHIVAMTTSGSSRYHNILKDIGPRIVIIEEAAEVFEAHIVSSLSKHCEHLILIGDHVQLRPNPAVYKLAVNYKLDISLFERLINNNTKRVMLNSQHRMRPEIAVLMKHFYSEPISNDKSVYSFENIVGLTRNIFFLNHNKLETCSEDSQTKLNKFEVQFLVQFSLYLLKQSYEQSKITILTMYLGQMFEIRKSLKSLRLNEIKVATVDNYQGEENDIILLSLVRSNKNNKIGFLKVDNRVCVALSRARKGFYCIGNLEMIASQSETWNKLIQSAKQLNCYGNSLTLTCGTHKQNDLEVSEPEHFNSRIDGGCLLPCGYRLKCGHACGLFCHTYDKEHVEYVCKKNCEKIMNCSHYCKKECGHTGECNKCQVLLDKTITDCGHVIKFRCDTQPLRKDCDHPCEKTLDCGHKCLKLCGSLSCLPCETRIKVESICKHKSNNEIECYNLKKKWLYQLKCNQICNETLDCGHVCTSKCSDCFGGYIHAGCKQNCERLLYCGHKCSIPCSKNCVPCQRECENKCAHSKCSLKCSEPCKPCLENCRLNCEHRSCSRKCHEICDIEPCNEPCNKKLRCGHLCIGLCGDPCPRLCRVCNETKVKEIFFGTEDEENARFVFLKDCKHIVEVTGMSEWLESRYANNETESIQFPECPKCKTKIRITLRYSNFIKKQLDLIESIKLKQYGDSAQNRIEQTQLINEISLFESKEKIKNCPRKTLFILNTKGKLAVNEFSFNELASYKNAWNVFTKLHQIESNAKELSQDFQKNFINFELNKIDSLIRNGFHIISNGKQKINEIFSETDRIESLLNYFLFYNLALTKTNEFKSEEKLIVDNELNKLEVTLFKRIQRFNEVKSQVESSFDILKKHIKKELTKVEKKMIVEAIGLSPGYCFKN